MPGITLANAEAQLAAWLAASAAVASNQSYEIAGRKLTRANASEIQKMVDYWNGLVMRLSRVVPGARVRTVAPGG